MSMNLMKQLKLDQLVARKSKNAVAASLLTTLLGEAQTIGKNDGNRETTTAEIQGLVRKFIKNNNETLSVISPADHRHSVLLEENALLTGYLPAQLSEEDLRSAVDCEIANGATNVGAIMKALKAQFDGLYDGKIASSVAAARLANRT